MAVIARTGYGSLTEYEDHHEITRCFDPPLERYEREIGPDKTYAFIEEEQDYPPIILCQLADPHTTICEDKNACHDQRTIDHLVNRTSFLKALPAIWVPAEPLRNLS